MYRSSHYTMYAPTPQKNSPWPQGSAAGGAAGGRNDPRSIPTPPISNQPRKKTRVSTTPEPSSSHYSYGPELSERRGPSPQSAASAGAVSPSKEDPRYGDFGELYDPYTLSAGASDAESSWYSRQSRDDGDRRTSSVAHYFTYATKPYSRQSTEDFENSQYSDSGESRAAPAGQNYHHSRRGQSEYPESSADAGSRWSPRGGPTVQLAPRIDASAVAAQQAVTEFFPELNETPYAGGDSSHSLAASVRLPCDSADSSYISTTSREHFSPGRVNQSLGSPYRPSSTRSPSQSDRPRGHCVVSTVTPESLYPMPKSPSANYNSAYTYTSHHNHHHYHHHHHHQQELNDYDDSDDNYENYDETDEDDDMSVTEFQDRLSYYPESSASPGGESHGLVTPMGTKSSSPDVANSASSTYPHSHGQNIRPSAKKSTTSSSPRRARKPPMPPTSGVAGANEKYDETDTQLVYLRQRGVSYKTIKSQLNLDEAESTLRGRFRTLTKPKNERLRKPVWTEEDIELLLKIVDPELPHIKWKQVSDTIVELGGSYKFGSSTCKKQYLALVQEGRAKPLNEGVQTSKRRKNRVIKTE